jgi:riboflavin synthase
VDGTARVAGLRTEGRTRVLEIEIPEDLAPFVVPREHRVDGVSLTIGPQLRGGRIELLLIPYTWDQTALRAQSAGDLVNVETDVVGRYVAHLPRAPASPAPEGLTGSA